MFLVVRDEQGENISKSATEHGVQNATLLQSTSPSTLTMPQQTPVQYGSEEKMNTGFYMPETVTCGQLVFNVSFVG